MVALQHGGDVIAQIAKTARELDGVFQGQLGARADGKVRRVHGVSHQHHMAVAVVHVPALAAHPLKIQPGGAAQVAGIGHERLAVQVPGKEFFAKRHRLVAAVGIQAMGLPHRLGCFHNERGGAVVKFVDMRLKPAVLGFFE